MTRQVYNDTWASAGSIIDPGSSKYSTGWVLEAPAFETFNYWQSKADQMLQHIERNGIPEFDLGTIYEQGAYARSGDIIYRSLTAANSGNTPASNPANWVQAFYATESKRYNHIINGNFDFWQRGTSGFVAAGYTADRWVMGTGSGSATVSRQTFALGQTDVPNNPKYYLNHNRSVAAAAGNTILEQRIEDVTKLAGKVITVSFYAKVAAGTKDLKTDWQQNFGSGGSPSATVDGAPDGDFTVTTSWQKFSFTHTIDSVSGKTLGTNGDDFLSIRFFEATGFSTFSLDIAQVQVEEGPVATDFVHRSLQEELAMCQRYYEKSYSLGHAPGTVTTDGVLTTNASGTSSTQAVSFNAQFAVNKRAKPTLTIYSPSTGSSGVINDVTGSTDVAALPGAEGEGSVRIRNDAAVTDNNLFQAHWVVVAEL